MGCALLVFGAVIELIAFGGMTFLPTGVFVTLLFAGGVVLLIGFLVGWAETYT